MLYNAPADAPAQITVQAALFTLEAVEVGRLQPNRDRQSEQTSARPGDEGGALLGFCNFSVKIGNLWVLVVNAAVKNVTVTDFIASTGFGVTAFQMFFFAGFAFVAALAFGLVAKRYRIVDYYRRVPV